MSDVQLKVEDYIATVTVNRPPVNAMTRETYFEVREIFQNINNRDDIRVVIFTATGEKAFIAGNDLNEFKSINENGIPQGSSEDRYELVRESFWSVYDCRVPVIGAINGPALGSGVAYASVCDLLICADHVYFSLPEINIGVMGGARHLNRLVPQHVTRYLHYTGERLPASKLQEYGSVLEIVSKNELMEKANEIARKIRDKSPLAIRFAKDSLNAIEWMDLKEGYKYEQSLTNRLRLYEDSKEALDAFLEKRKPVFKLK